MTISQKNAIGLCPVSLLLLSSLVTERPDKEQVQAMGLDFRGDEGEEFSKLLRIPYGRFVPPFLAAHQKVVAPQEFMSKLLGMYLEGGFKFEKSTGVRPDHVGVVLEFLALLESEKKIPPDELQALIADPLKQFAEALRKATEHPLYRKVADELTEMVETETVTFRQKQI
jgi:TorA maturation chaperone TorD